MSQETRSILVRTAYYNAGQRVCAIGQILNSRVFWLWYHLLKIISFGVRVSGTVAINPHAKSGLIVRINVYTHGYNL